MPHSLPCPLSTPMHRPRAVSSVPAPAGPGQGLAPSNSSRQVSSVSDEYTTELGPLCCHEQSSKYVLCPARRKRQFNTNRNTLTSSRRNSAPELPSSVSDFHNLCLI